MNNELTKNELAKNKLTKEDISNLFQSLQYGVSISSFWSDESIIAFNQADWDKAFINHAHKLNEQYTKNCILVNTVLTPILKYPNEVLDDDLFDYLFECTKDMYYENYDDPYTLWDLSSCLLEHYLCCGRLDYIIFSYQLKAYAALEMSRTGDKAAGKASVDLYKTV